MVDLVVLSDVNQTIYNIDDDQWEPIMVTNLVGYIIYMDDTAPTILRYRRTDDGGLTWSSPTTISTLAIESGAAFAVYYDRYTPGITATDIHIVWTQSNAVVYRSLTPITDALGTLRTVISPGSAIATHVGIGVARNGDLWVGWNSADASLLDNNRRSTNGGASWADPGASFLEADGDDIFFVRPASNTGDDADMWVVYYDESASQLSLKFWDDSAGTFTETLINSSGDTNWSAIEGAVSINHADGHLFMPARTASTGSHDFQFWEINSATSFTQRTNIQTAVTGPRRASITVDQNTGRIYVAWFDTLVNLQGQVDHSFSDDGGVTWSVVTQYNTDTDRTMRAIKSMLSIAAGDSGRFLPIWHDERSGELMITNVDNSVVLGVLFEVNGGVEIDYTPFFGGASLNIVFDMQVESWKHILTPQPILTNLANFENRAISLNKVNFDIEVTGVAVTHHAVHPLTAGEGHVPDVVDLEEMALLFNRGISVGSYLVVRVILNSDGDIERRYQGVIKNMILFQEGGVNVWRFKMLFGVDWNTSRPALREWV